MDLLKSYYQAISSSMEAEVRNINGLFDHQGVKGAGNENILMTLLSKFLPKKYGIGTGVVVDRNGKQSKQCDVVIYDATNYPEILGVTSTKFFPVDFVYAIIEVKTKLDSAKTGEAIENIRSVHELDYIKQEFRVSPTGPILELTADTVLAITKSTTPPLGMVFSYSTNTSVFETFSGWFKPTEDNLGPSHIFALDQGFISQIKSTSVASYVVPYVKDGCVKIQDGETSFTKNGKKWIEIDGEIYPFSEAGDETIAIDQSKVLLNFLLILNECLKNKHISPNINVYKEYLNNEYRQLFTIIEGKLYQLPQA